MKRRITTSNCPIHSAIHGKIQIEDAVQLATRSQTALPARLRPIGIGGDIEHENEVNAFLGEAARISRNSWQYRKLGAAVENSPEERESSQGCAARCVAVLPVAMRGRRLRFVRGFQYANSFYYTWCGFDQRYAEYSPGKVLLYLLIEDLCNHRPPKCLTFLEGGAPYKDVFGTGVLEDASVLLVHGKGRLAARLALVPHSAFRSTLRLLKHWLRQYVAQMGQTSAMTN